MARDVEYYRQQVEQALAAGFHTKQSRKDALSDLNRAYDLLRRAIHDELLKAPHEQRGVHWQKLYGGLPDLHRWKDTHERMYANYPLEVAHIRNLVKLRKQVVAAPTQPKPEREVVTKDDGPRMTCQVCDRAIRFDRYGKLAHHGYQRPGWGSQTASCPGARKLPYEASREALEHLIGHLEQRLAYTHLCLTNARAGTKVENVSLANVDRDTRLREVMSVHLHMGREQFERFLEVYPKTARRYAFDHRNRDAGWHTLRSIAIKQLEAQLNQLQHDIDHFRNRHDRWPGVTHQLDAEGVWQPVQETTSAD